jgi:CheY-like chemotaxis protein
MHDPNNRPEVTVLLVDDDRICRNGMKRALRDQDLNNPVYEAQDGIQALKMLRSEGGHAPIPRPFTILLDLNMPLMTGHEFLRELRSDPSLSDANVFVISTSMTKADVQKSYAMNVAGYVMKSGATSGFSELAQMLREYWRVVTLA